MSGRTRAGYVGIFGSLFLLFAFLSMAWSSLVPQASEYWLALSIQFIGGLSISTAFGFRIYRSSVEQEFDAFVHGLIGGIVAIATQLAISAIHLVSPYSSFGESMWMVILAPVGETLAFIVAPYEVVRYHYPNLQLVDAIVLAIASDIAFTLYHYFAYFDQADWIWVAVVLFISNTAFMMVYHGTRNALAPFVSHLMVNLVSAGSFVVQSLQTILPIVILLGAGFFILFIILTETHEEVQTW